MPKSLDSSTLTDPQLEELAAVGLTDVEISNLLGIKPDQWRAQYPSVITKGRARLRQSLRRAQIKSALSGNASMLIWLGKQYLGQRDTRDLNLEAEHRAISITPNVLERLQTSYKLTLEQLRTRGALHAPADASEQAPGGGGGGAPGDRHGVFKTDPLPQNSGLDDGGRVAIDDFVREPGMENPGRAGWKLGNESSF